MANIGISTNNFLKSPKFTGQVQLPDGSSLFPALTFTNEAGLDSGMYRLSNGTFGFSTNGVEAIKIAPSLVTFSLPVNSTGTITAPTFIGALQGNATSATTAGSVSSITSSQITTALGFTPYNTTNPANYIDTGGARNAVSVTGAGGSYNSTTGVITITGAVSSVQGHTGAVVLNNADISGALGYTPYNFLAANNIAIGNNIQQVWSGSFTDAAPSSAALININETTVSTQTATTPLAFRARMLQITTLAGSTSWGFNIGLRGQTRTLSLDQTGSFIHTGVPGDAVGNYGGGRFSVSTGTGGPSAFQPSGVITMATGISSGGGTGSVTVTTGADSGTGPSGAMIFTTGNSAGGGTGSINITTGNDSGVGTTGSINLIAGTSSAGTNGSVNISTSGVTRMSIQPSGNVSGTLVFPITMGGTGASTTTTALSNLGAQPALGFTPYNATNPSNYIDVSGARNAISVTGGGSYNSSTGVITIAGGSSVVTSVAGKTGAVSLVAADVSGALAASNNLADVADVGASRTSLGLGTAATQNTGTSGANLPFLNGNNTWAGTQLFNSNITMSSGLVFTGSPTLGASAIATFSYELPVTRFYIGDGTGFRFAFSKRVGSVTSDLISITDSGVATFNTRPVFNGQTPYDSGNLGIATSSVVGLVRPGSGLAVDAGGALSVTSAPSAGTITYNPIIVATAGQTIFSVPSGYTSNLVMVYVNGYKLPAADYTAVNGTTVTLAVASTGGEEIETVVFASQSLSGSSIINRTPFTATDNQTVFPVTYVAGMLLVKVRGDILPTSDYVAANGTSVTFNVGLPAGTVGEFLVFTSINLSNAVNSTGGVMSGDLTVPSMNGGPLAGLRNFIINGDMRIAQRALTYTLTGSGAYGSIDRWFASQSGGAGTAVFNQVAGSNGFQYLAKLSRNSSATSTGTLSMGTALETLNSIPLQGKTVTLSFWARAGTTFTAAGNNIFVSLYQGTGVDQSAAAMGAWTGVSTVITGSQVVSTTLTKCQFTGVVSSTATQLGITFSWPPAGTAGADDSLYITGVQLEIGGVATPFENRPYGMEFDLCRRYFQKFGGSGIAYDIIFQGYASVANTNFAIPLTGEPMRANPTCAISNIASWNGYSSITIPQFVYGSNGSGYFNFKQTATGALAFGTLDATTYLTASAEL